MVIVGKVGGRNRVVHSVSFPHGYYPRKVQLAVHVKVPNVPAIETLDVLGSSLVGLERSYFSE